jgi:cobalt-precorrin 5A hydrolase
MDLGQTLMVAGIGCRSGVSAEQVDAAIEAAMGSIEATGAASYTLTAIATPAAKAHETGIIAAATARGIPLMLISQSALEAANSATLTRSEHSMAAMNVHSVAEAAALAGATALTGAAALAGAAATIRLLGPRIAVGPVTCALADTAAAAVILASVDAHAAASAPVPTTITPNTP